MVARELELIRANEDERPALSRIEGVLNSERSAQHRLPKLVGPGGETIEIPLSVFRVLQRIVTYMVQGKAFSVIPYDQTLTTQEAADLLNVSRPFLIKLLESGELPFVKVGTHRRVQYGDLLAYKDRRHKERRKALADIANISQEAGEY
jgi:excisionase family DNA binding protein